VQQLVERLHLYRTDLKCRMENKQTIVFDSGLPGGIVEFTIEDVGAMSPSCSNPRFCNFGLVLSYQSAASVQNEITHLAISLDTQDRRIEIVADPCLEDTREKFPLIVSYRDQCEEGKRVTLRPREFDAPNISEAEILLVGMLFNEMTTRLGMIPETPFDFTVIRTFIRKQEETHKKVLKLWQDLSSDWEKIGETWDNHWEALL
jgi:hypothetical protein